MIWWKAKDSMAIPLTNKNTFQFMLNAFPVGLLQLGYNIDRSSLCDTIVYDLAIGDSLYIRKNWADSPNCWVFKKTLSGFQEVLIVFSARNSSLNVSRVNTSISNFQVTSPESWDDKSPVRSHSIKNCTLCVQLKCYLEFLSSILRI